MQAILHIAQVFVENCHLPDADNDYLAMDLEEDFQGVHIEFDLEKMCRETRISP